MLKAGVYGFVLAMTMLWMARISRHPLIFINAKSNATELVSPTRERAILSSLVICMEGVLLIGLGWSGYRVIQDLNSGKRT